MTFRIGTACCFGLLIAQLAAASDHPGNVFVAGNHVQIAVPKTWKSWRAVDVDGKEVGHGQLQDAKAELGKLPIGYFELRATDGSERITAGVVAKNSPAENTPIALDAAMSWFYSEPQQ